MSVWTRVGVIAAIVSAAVPAINYFGDWWENTRADIELDGYRRGLSVAQTEVDQQIKASNIKFKNEINVLLENKNVELRSTKLALNDTNNSNTLLNSQLNIARKNLESSNQNLISAEGQVQSLRTQVEDLQTELGKQRIKFDDISRQLVIAKNELTIANNTIENQRQKIKSANVKIPNAITKSIPKPQNNCVSNGEIVEVPLDDFFQECKSNQIIALRYVNSRHGIKNVKVFVENTETRLKTGEAINLSNGCRVRFLSFTHSGTKNSPAKFRLECS